MKNEQVIAKNNGDEPKAPQNAKERFYEKLRMPLWLLDTIIVLLVVAIVVIVIIGR